MKQIITQTTEFKCDHCDFKSAWRSTVEQHEKTHLQATCKHEQVYYTLRPGSYEGYELEQSCSVCGKDIVKPVPEYDQEFLKKLWDIL